MSLQPRILFIDDDPFNTLLAQRIFKKMELDAVVSYAADGEEALTWWRKNGNTLPDIILLDLNMPNLGGLELLAKLITEGASLKNVRIYIMLSTDLPEHVLADPSYSYVFGFVHRPLSQSKLEELLA